MLIPTARSHLRLLISDVKFTLADWTNSGGLDGMEQGFVEGMKISFQLMVFLGKMLP